MTGKRKPVESLEEEDGDARQVETVETLEDGNVIYWTQAFACAKTASGGIA